MKNEKLIHMVAFILLWVGGINWGLIGLLNINLVGMLLGMGMLTKIIYILVGVSAVYLVATHMSYCKYCGSKK